MILAAWWYELVPSAIWFHTLVRVTVRVRVRVRGTERHLVPHLGHGYGSRVRASV